MNAQIKAVCLDSSVFALLICPADRKIDTADITFSLCDSKNYFAFYNFQRQIDRLTLTKQQMKRSERITGD